MELARLFLFGIVAWGILAFVVVPLAKRRADRASIAIQPRRKAVTAVAQTLAGMSFWFTLSTAIAAAIVWYFSRISPVNLGQAEAALAKLRGLTNWIGTIGSGATMVTLAICLFGLLVWTNRRVKRNTQAQLSQELRDALIEVSQSLDNGTAETLRPTPAMDEIKQEIEKRAAHLQNNQSDASEDGKSNSQDELRQTLVEEIKELETMLVNLDLLRRAEALVASRQSNDVQKRQASRFSTIFISEGLLQTTGFGLRVIGIAAMLATVPASIGLVGPLTLDGLKESRLVLSESARNFRFAIESGEINQAFETIVQDNDGERQENSPELDEEDVEIANQMARGFESNLAGGNWLNTGIRVGHVTAQRATRSLLREKVRADLLQRAASGSRAIDVSLPIARQANSTIVQETEALLARSVSVNEPVTPWGRRAATANLELAKENPKLWARLKDNYRSYRSSFGRAAPPQRMYGLAISQTLGEALSGFSGDPSFFGSQAKRFGANATTDAVSAYFEASYKKFVIEAARTGDFGEAARGAGRLAGNALSDADVRALAELVEAMPEPAVVETRTRAARATVAVQSADINVPNVERAVVRYANATGGTRPALSAEALAEFADYFPGRAGEEQVTRKAKVSRTANLDGAPPAPGNETRSYQRRSKTMASRSGSYRSLRGFSRIGGVLIGRNAESTEKVQVDAFDWLVRDDKFSFDLALDGGEKKSFGPYSAAIANLALSYAADGRPTTVTMVSAEPLLELKILTHPVLVDTGLGCSARRLDQFVDEIDSEDAELAGVREHDTRLATGEVALYGLARALQIVFLAEDPEIASLLKTIGADGVAESARQELDSFSEYGLVESRISFAEPKLAIASKPAYFDRGLVNRIQACMPDESLDEFVQCFRRKVDTNRSSIADDPTMAWLAPTPEFQVWSGVREKAYNVDASLNFIKKNQDDPTWPFEFIVQMALTSPAYFADPDQVWFDDDNQAIGEFVDDSPWKFQETGKMLRAAISNGVKTNLERSRVLGDMQDFALLQRLFRAAIDGPLSESFPLQDLPAIQQATMNSVNRAAKTLRWNVRPGALEMTFWRQLISIDNPAKGVQSCIAFIETFAETDPASLSRVDHGVWDANCGVDRLSASNQRSLASLAERTAAARELRTALNVAADEALADILYQNECPQP